MDNLLWKWVWRIALLVGIVAGIVTTIANYERLSPPLAMPLVCWLTGVCLVVGLVGLVLDFKPWKWRSSARKAAHDHAFIEKGMVASIASLDPEEWQVVDGFIRGRANTLELPVDDPVIAGLLAKRILVLAARIAPLKRGRNGRAHPFCPMMLSPLAKDCWERNPPPQWH
jgi:hypothetical protein